MGQKAHPKKRKGVAQRSLGLVLLQFSWRRGSKDSRGQGFKGLFSKDCISAVNILSISVMSFFGVPNSLISMKPKSPANEIWVSLFKYSFAFHLNPWTLDPLDPSVAFKAFALEPLNP